MDLPLPRPLFSLILKCYRDFFRILHPFLRFEFSKPSAAFMGLLIFAIVVNYPQPIIAQENQSEQPQEQQQDQRQDQSQENSQTTNRSDSRPSAGDAQKTPGKVVSPIPKEGTQTSADEAAQTGAGLVETMRNIDWGMAIFICLFSMLSATLFIWMRFAKYQYLGVITNFYSISLIILVGTTCLGLFMLGSNALAANSSGSGQQSYSHYLIALGSTVVSNFFPAIGRLLSFGKKSANVQDSAELKNLRNYFYTEILFKVQAKMRTELMQYAREFEWKLIKRLLTRMVTDCLSTEIISEDKAKALEEKINQYKKLNDEYDDIEAKYYAISTMLKEVHFKKVRAVFLEARG